MDRVQELLAELERERRRREVAETEREEERQRLEEERRRLEEERQRREEAEVLAANSEPSTLPLFLRACHELPIKIVTDPSRTTQGAVTNPTNRRFPSRITLWDTFLEQQMSVWKTLSSHPTLLSEKMFPSKHQLEYVNQLITPITSESDLRYYERDTVENQVRIVVDRITEYKDLCEAFGLRGSVTFESHTNLGGSQGKRKSLSQGAQQTVTSPTTTGQFTKKLNTQKQKHESIAVGGQADRFCIYRQDGDEHVPAIAIEYKAPHKLTQAEMATGLTAEIRPAQDVIGQESDDVDFCCRRLVAAVITQLFSYMVRKGIRYGYVCTGEAFIFVCIPDDPSSVQCALCIPALDVRETQDDDLPLTAVAQVLAFTITALASPPVPQRWYDAAAELDVWPMEYSDILEQTPPASRPKHVSPLYRGRRPSNLPPFRMTLRSGCRPSERIHQSTSSSSPSPPPPSPSIASSRLGESGCRTGAGGSSQPRSDGRSGGPPGREARNTRQVFDTIEAPAIQTRPYCSQECLLALKDSGRSLDPLCPNYQDHQKVQIDLHRFLSLIRKQLALDRGSDADSCPLYKAGSSGALFKVRLSSYGYTLVAKGVEYDCRGKLEEERRIYDKLQDLQGVYIPVCLGVVSLEPKYPYYYDGGIYTHLLFLSWAGEPIWKTRLSNHVTHMASRALQAIHLKGVLHGDAELRNILWNETCQQVMIVDFGQATVQNALSSIFTNPVKKKRRSKKPKLEDIKASLANELQSFENKLGILAT